MTRLTNANREEIVNNLVEHTFKKRQVTLEKEENELAEKCYFEVTHRYNMVSAFKEIKAFGEQTSNIEVIIPKVVNRNYFYYRKYNLKTRMYGYSDNEKVTLRFGKGNSKYIPREFLYAAVSMADPIISNNLRNSIIAYDHKCFKFYEDRDKLICETTAILKGMTTHKHVEDYSRLLSGFLPQKENPKYLPIKPPEKFKALVACCRDENCTGKE